MDPGSGDLGEIVYSGLPGNTVGMATMGDMSEASKQKSASQPPSPVVPEDDDFFRTPNNDGGPSPIQLPTPPQSGPPTGLISNRRGRRYTEIPEAYTPNTPVSLSAETASPSVFGGDFQAFDRDS